MKKKRVGKPATLIWDGTPRMSWYTPALQRFHASYTGEPNSGCWIWTHSTTQDYGFIMIDGKRHAAHRYSWTIHNGGIPVGKEVCHSCDVPSCVNPKHLFLGTHRENCKDMSRKGRHGARKGQPRRKLVADDVRAIRSSGERRPVLAARYGVSTATISKVRLLHRWRNV